MKGIFTEAGFGKLYFYYPYPDYKFPSCIYSEDWLPQAGELMDNRRNFDRDRLKLFDERQRSMIHCWQRDCLQRFPIPI